VDSLYNPQCLVAELRPAFPSPEPSLPSLHSWASLLSFTPEPWLCSCSVKMHLGMTGHILYHDDYVSCPYFSHIVSDTSHRLCVPGLCALRLVPFLCFLALGWVQGPEPCPPAHSTQGHLWPTETTGGRSKMVRVRGETGAFPHVVLPWWSLPQGRLWVSGHQ
jgi:hypothetical protein